MSSLKEEYKNFLDDIEKNIKNPEDLKYVKERFSEFANTVLDRMDSIIQYKEDKIELLESTQKELSQKMDKIQSIIEHIEKDIYSDEGFDFEIVCPYCNYEFVIDVDEDKTEVECPECKNIIELDWTGDIDDDDLSSCSGHCSGCSGCDDEDDEENNDEDDDM